jgi:propanol-preferring alcohol dehydrogenase
MAKTMKAAVVREFGKPLTIDEVPVPQPGPGMIQVAIRASGVCHTDLHAAEGDWPVKPNPPFIPGHEGVGYVSAVGNCVKHVKEGDRVGVPWLYTACGHCKHCLGGWETLCESQQNTGYSVNGGSRNTWSPTPISSATCRLRSTASRSRLSAARGTPTTRV